MKTTIILFLMLLCCYHGSAQDSPAGQLDSLEGVLSRIDINDTESIVQLSEYLITKTNSDEKKIYLLGKIISSYSSRNDKGKSIEYLFRAKKIAERKGDHELTAKVYVSIASLYASLNLNDKAKVYLDEAWELANKLPMGQERNSLEAFVHNEMGNFYLNTSNFKSANDHYQKSLAKFTATLPVDSSANTPLYYKSLLLNYGKSFVQLGQPDLAEVYLIKASAVIDTIYPHLRFNIDISLSDVYISRKQFKRAIDTLQAIIKDPEFKYAELKSMAYMNLATSYKELGDLKNYSVYNEKYLALTTTVKGDDMTAINKVFSAEQQELKSDTEENRLLYIGTLCCVSVICLIWIIKLRRNNNRDKVAFQSVIANLTKMQSVGAGTNKSVVSESSVSIPELVAHDILEKLRDFEKSSEYTNPNLSIATLAIQFKTNTTYLSEIINREKGKNFNTYINELRITYICNQIVNNPEFLSYKISYLAQQCGFKSHSAFATVFKTVTGISPSAFIKQATAEF